MLNSKVYVGLITSNFDPAFDRKYIRLLPILSGYRDSETKEVTFTHNYSSVLQSVKDDPEQFQGSASKLVAHDAEGDERRRRPPLAVPARQRQAQHEVVVLP